MKTPAILLMLTALCPALLAQTTQTMPATSPVSEFIELPPAAVVDLARQSMLDFLANRSSPQSQPIPARLEAFQAIKSGAAVGLRIDGQLKAQAFATTQREGFLRNVAIAAVKALRSSSLPDRVTPELIQSATIEVEAISNLAEVQQLDLTYVQGITGLMLKSVSQEAFSMPSAAYEFNLNAAQAQARCSGQFSARKAAAAAWFTFSGPFWVGYPGGSSFNLVRGKILGEEESDTASHARTASQIGLYLQLHQGRNGCFRAAGTPATLSEHLYVTYAMAKLANAGVIKFDPLPALRYAKGLAKKADNLTFLASEQPQEQLLSAAFYILASEEAGLKTDELRDALVTTIAARMELPALPSRLDGTSPNAASNASLYIASRAMLGKSPKAAGLLVNRAQAVAPRTGLEALWKSWAGLNVAQLPPELEPVQRLAGTDEMGGFLLPGEKTPQTLVTALASLKIARAKAKSPQSAYAQQLAEAQKFCQRMTYKPYEAYFAPDSGDWIGAVRQTPAAAEISLPAMAAAIECLLAE